MEFKDLEDLKNTFLAGKFKIEDEIHVSGIRFRKRISPEFKMDDIINNNYKGLVIYARNEKDKVQTKVVGLDEWIMLLWASPGRMRILPYDTRTISQARAGGRRITEDGMQKYKKPDNIIGSTVEVKVTSLPGSGVIKGKVDTGATICSLHADNYKINREAGTITFMSPELSRNELTVPMVDQQSVKSADGGSEYRPVIELNIKVNGKIVNNVKFNLNDRSHMEFTMLVGKNALGDGKFLIDPRMDESNEEEFDLTALQEELRQEVWVESPQKDITELYTLIKESDATFADIIRHIRTDVTENVMEDLDD